MAGRVISAILTLKDKDFSSGLRDASGRLNDFGRQFKTAENGVSRFKDSAVRSFATVAATATTLAATGIAALAVSAGKMAVEMDSAFNLLQAKTGVTGAELEGLKSQAKDVYANGYGASIGQLTNDLAVLRQNLGTVDSKTLESAQILSKISENADINSVSRALRSMTSSFPGATQQQSLDLITRTLQVGGDASGDLLDTFNEYSGVIGAAGISMDSFANIMVNGSKAGARNYDVVADTLKEFNILTKSGSDATKQAFQTLGMDANKVASDLAAGGERGEQAYYDTMNALSKLDDKAKYSTGVALMGTKFEDLEVKTIEAMGAGTDALGKFEGATQKAGESIESGFGFRMNKVWSGIKVGVTDAFSSEGGTELLDSIATKAEELAPKIETIITKAIEFGNKVRENWGTIAPVLATAGAAIGTFMVVMGTMKAISTVTAIITGFRTAMALATAGQWAMNTAMLASPFTWVAIAIAAVVAAGVALYLNWDTVKLKAGQLWDKAKEVFGNLYNWGASKIQGVTDFFGGLVDKVTAFTSKITNFKMPAWVSTIGEKIGSAASKVSNFVNGSHATGLNSVPFDGYIAELHKDEMVIPARQSKELREQGFNINNIDQVAGGSGTKQSSAPVVRTSTTTNNKGGATVIIQNLIAKGVTTSEVVDELVPQLQMRLANM